YERQLNEGQQCVRLMAADSMTTLRRKAGRRPDDLRISCKRLARPALSYVPLNTIGGSLSTELRQGTLVSCMRWLGRTESAMPLSPIQDIRHARRHDADPHNAN